MQRIVLLARPILIMFFPHPIKSFIIYTRSESFTGLGNVPALTLRHKVGALNGNGAGWSGLLGLWTSWLSRMKALSGSASNTER